MKKQFRLKICSRFFSYLNILALLILLLFFQDQVKSQNFPAGFSQVFVGTIYYPTSLDFAPDGRIFCTEKAGKVKIIKNGAVLTTPFLNVSVDQLNERGLSAVAIDPNFNTNHYVYVYYTTSGSPVHNRLSRFTANGDVAVAGSEVVILDFEPVVNSIHNSGGMVFGTDGKLYLAVGNDNVNSNSQDLNNYKGKVIRINTDGSVPSGNPFTGSASAQRIWAYGLRNPWTLAIQPGTGKIFANEVGEGAWEEINNVTTGGKNFGWPGAEGMSGNPAYTNPVYTYPHGAIGSNDGCAITGGAFFNPASTNYPSLYTGKYFFIDYCNHWINYLDIGVSPAVKTNFASNLGGGCNYIKVGPDGNLYYYSISQNSLYKIIYSNNTAPMITTQPVNQSVSQGQTASFHVSATGSAPLSFQWQKNNVNIPGANSPTYTINNVQNSNAGAYRAVVTNGYGSVTSNSATLTVTAFNAIPTASIFTPPAGTLYHGGDTVNFSGDANDAEDGNLPASAFEWIIEFHHDAHIHPGPNIPPGVKSGSFPIGKTGETSANVWYRIILVVTDSEGAKDTVYRDVYPKKSVLTLLSQPSGLNVLLDDQPHATTYSVMAVSGMFRKLGVVPQQTLNATVYTFDHWAHGGNATQTITITDSNQNFTAVFVPTGTASSCSASGTILREYWAAISGGLAGVPFNSTPTSTSQLTIFEGPSNVADNYGSRIRGYLCPPASGNYTFWIASDNSSELWLSNSNLPSGKIKIASVTGYTQPRQWTKYPSQQSPPQYLQAGQKYYVEAIHAEGTQGDNLSVGWQLPDGTLERPIPGSRLSPFSGGGGGGSGGNGISIAITSPADNTSFSSPVNITINASATTTNGSISKVEFYSGGSKIGESTTAPYSMIWWNVTTGNYVLKAVATDNLSQSKTSQTVDIIVTGCITPTITPDGPTTFCSGSVNLTTDKDAGNSYQWKKDGVNISGATNYLYNASVSGDYQVKVTNGTCVGWSAPVKITVSNALSAKITVGGPLEFCLGGQVKLYANTCAGYAYQWKKNGSDIPGATSSTYIATTSGSFQVQIIQGASVAWSAFATTTVNNCPGSKAISSDSLNLKRANDFFHLSVYPNPTTGLFSFDFSIEEADPVVMEVKVLSSTGQVVYSRPPANVNGSVKETIDLPNTLPTGVYILQLRIANTLQNTKVVLSNGK